MVHTDKLLSISLSVNGVLGKSTDALNIFQTRNPTVGTPQCREAPSTINSLFQSLPDKMADDLAVDVRLPGPEDFHVPRSNLRAEASFDDVSRPLAKKGKEPKIRGEFGSRLKTRVALGTKQSQGNRLRTWEAKTRPLTRKSVTLSPVAPTHNESRILNKSR
jgi:hypothetical protein